MKKVGLMIIGISGAIGSALTVGLWLYKRFKNNTTRWGMLTDLHPFCNVDLTPIENIEIGGWDVKNPDPISICKKYKIFPNLQISNSTSNIPLPLTYNGIVIETDFVHKEGYANSYSKSYEQAIEEIRNNIQSFKTEHNLSEVIIVNLSSPHSNIEIPEWYEDSRNFKENLKNNHPYITSGMLYCLAAVYEHCPFIDFTPSVTLIPKAIIEEADNYKVPLAGRDGSTGQTLIKSVLAHMFEVRNLHIDGWYSTNILGNQDGYALSKQEFNKNKLEDKTQGLQKILGYKIDHLVDIKYFPPKGDQKESWDSVEFRGWLGENMNLKINWVGKDSVLASPLILDLVRLMEFSKRLGLTGMQSQLGLFFKNPLGTDERRFFNLYEKFIKFYENIPTDKKEI